MDVPRFGGGGASSVKNSSKGKRNLSRKSLIKIMDPNVHQLALYRKRKDQMRNSYLGFEDLAEILNVSKLIFRLSVKRLRSTV